MDTIFTGTLTAADVKRHIPHRFSVPAGAQSVHVELRFAPLKTGEVRNMLTLTLFDATGFRGGGHRGGDRHEVVVSRESATPGYLPGPLPAGKWVAQIDTHMLGPDAPCTYELRVAVEMGNSETPDLVRTSADFSAVVRAALGWYRGDLHTHTYHSDGAWTPDELTAAARARGLDFIALTDHNTISPLAEMASLSNAGLLTMGGMELTTFWGHALCLGTTAWIDWRVDAAGQGMAAIASNVYASDGIFIIAHPRSIGDPRCTGCRWVYPAMMPGPARCVEIWNGPWWSQRGVATVNEEALALWYGWLNEGHRLVATAGSDSHNSDHFARALGFNVIYAEALSQAALLQAIGAGHLYLSSGPALDFRADGNGQSAMMGDLLAAGDATTGLTLKAAWQDAPEGAYLRLIENGQSIEQRDVAPQGTAEWTVPGQDGRWYLVELRGADHSLLAIPNPIYIR